MQKKLHIKKGDLVQVISGGAKDAEGKKRPQGVVLSIDRESERAIVEGANFITKHNKPTATNPQGGIDKKESSIHISNLMLVVKGKATRTGKKVVDGKKVRFAKEKSLKGEVIK